MINYERLMVKSFLDKNGMNYEYFDRLFAIDETSGTSPKETYKSIQEHGSKLNQKLIFERDDKRGYTLALINNGVPTYLRFNTLKELIDKFD